MRRISGLALAIAVVTVPWPVGSASATVPSPKMIVQPPFQRPGSSVLIVGQGFPASSAVQLQICGNNDLDGSADCAVGNAAEVVATGQGQFAVPLIVTIPPKPCPCVVSALDFSLSSTPEAPITVLGAPIAAPTPTALATLQVVRASFEGNGPWTAWFGAEAKRTLVLTVHNPNAVPFVNPSLVLTLGPAANPRSDEATARILGSIAVDGNRTFRIPLTFPAFSMGEQHVAGVIGNAGLSRRITVSTSIFPWGLVIVLLVVLEFALFGITGFVRERHRRQGEIESAVTAPAPNRAAAESLRSRKRGEFESATPPR